MAGNRNLQDSYKNKQDEFYTNISLIERELKHYRQHFKDKIILCNCDDPYESEFFKYFAINFNVLGLKKLITTCYDGSPIAQQELPFSMKDKKPYKLELNEVKDWNGDGRVDLLDVEYYLKNNEVPTLKGNGDFRNEECISLLKEADIVVTNPPFSLFREYVAQLMEYNKEFLIIGNLNAVKYKDILPLFMRNKIWLGYNSGHLWLKVPTSYEEKKTDFKIDEEGQKWRRMGNIGWFTNLDIKKRHEDLILYKNYSAEKYPKYDNYDAIEISKNADIPCDYFGVMGVPITFMDRHNPDQFEIIGV